MRRKIFILKLTTIILIYWFLDIVTICIYIVDIFISVHNFTCSFYFEYNSFLRNYYFFMYMSVLLVCLCTTCMPGSLRKPEHGVRSPGAGL